MAAYGTKPTPPHVCTDVRFRRQERKSYAPAELWNIENSHEWTTGLFQFATTPEALIASAHFLI